MPATRSRPSRSPIRCLSGRIGLTRPALLAPERQPSGQVRQTLDALIRRSELQSSWYGPARLRLVQEGWLSAGPVTARHPLELWHEPRLAVVLLAYLVHEALPAVRLSRLVVASSGELEVLEGGTVVPILLLLEDAHGLGTPEPRRLGRMVLFEPPCSRLGGAVTHGREGLVGAAAYERCQPVDLLRMDEQLDERVEVGACGGIDRLCVPGGPIVLRHELEEVVIAEPARVLAIPGPGRLEGDVLTSHLLQHLALEVGELECCPRSPYIESQAPLDPGERLLQPAASDQHSRQPMAVIPGDPGLLHKANVRLDILLRQEQSAQGLAPAPAGEVRVPRTLLVTGRGGLARGLEAGPDLAGESGEASLVERPGRVLLQFVGEAERVVIHPGQQARRRLVRRRPHGLAGLDPAAEQVGDERAQAPARIIDLVCLLVAAGHECLVEGH